MDVNYYRLAYNIFHYNWQRFGIPDKDIPPPKFDEDFSLDRIIPDFSKAVTLYQIASREDVKEYLDERRNINNHDDFYTYLTELVEEYIPTDTKLKDPPIHTVKDKIGDSVKEDLSKEAVNECLLEDVMEKDLEKDAAKNGLSKNGVKIDSSKDAKNEGLLEDATKEGLPIDAMNEYLQETSMNVDLPKDVIEDLAENKRSGWSSNTEMEEDSPEDSVAKCLPPRTLKTEKEDNDIFCSEVPGAIAHSLAICIELTIYKNEYRQYMKEAPVIWEKCFHESVLESLCEQSGCTVEDLKDYGENMDCTDKFLEKFIAENRYVYEGFKTKFLEFGKNYCRTESPDQLKFIPEVRNFPKGLTLRKMKEKLAILKKICKCTKGVTDDEMQPLLDDYSPGTPSSTPTSPEVQVGTSRNMTYNNLAYEKC